MSQIDLLADDPEADAAPVADDNAHVREQRADYVYDAHRDFSSPVIIRGTNRVFRAFTGLTVVEEPSGEALDELIGKAKEVDGKLRLQRIESVAVIKLDVVTPDVITFRVREPDGSVGERLFYFETPLLRKNPLGFKNFTGLLAIPYVYSRKNPTSLNLHNFSYWLRHAAANQDKKVPIDLVYEVDAQEISYVPTTPDGDPEGEETRVQAHRIVNVLKAPRGRGRSETSPETPPISTRLPFLSDILSGVKKEIASFAPEVEPQLQAYALGYDDTNRGRHFARIVFDSPATSFIQHGETYQLGLNVEADFSGESKDFGDVQASFILFRQICSNGMMAAWGNEDQAEFRDAYVAEQLSAAGFTVGDSEDGGLQDAIDIRRNAEGRFAMIFGEGGLKIPVAQANNGLDSSPFSTGLKFFLESATQQNKRLEKLRSEFAQVEEEEFVRAVNAVQTTFKLASPELVKFALIEYMAGQISGKQAFKSPWDWANFLTLLGRAYDTAIQADIERKAIAFSLKLGHVLAKKHAEAQVSLSEKYRNHVNPSLIPE